MHQKTASTQQAAAAVVREFRASIRSPLSFCCSLFFCLIFSRWSFFSAISAADNAAATAAAAAAAPLRSSEEEPSEGLPPVFHEDDF